MEYLHGPIDSLNLSREQHYDAINHALDISRLPKDEEYMFRVMSQAQIHATLLVEKAIREQMSH